MLSDLDQFAAAAPADIPDWFDATPEENPPAIPPAPDLRDAFNPDEVDLIGHYYDWPQERWKDAYPKGNPYHRDCTEVPAELRTRLATYRQEAYERAELLDREAQRLELRRMVQWRYAFALAMCGERDRIGAQLRNTPAT